MKIVYKLSTTPKTDPATPVVPEMLVGFAADAFYSLQPLAKESEDYLIRQICSALSLRTEGKPPFYINRIIRETNDQVDHQRDAVLVQVVNNHHSIKLISIPLNVNKIWPPLKWSIKEVNSADIPSDFQYEANAPDSFALLQQASLSLATIEDENAQSFLNETSASSSIAYPPEHKAPPLLAPQQITEDLVVALREAEEAAREKRQAVADMYLRHGETLVNDKEKAARLLQKTKTGASMLSARIKKLGLTPPAVTRQLEKLREAQYKADEELLDIHQRFQKAYDQRANIVATLKHSQELVAFDIYNAAQLSFNHLRAHTLNKPEQRQAQLREFNQHYSFIQVSRNGALSSIHELYAIFTRRSLEDIQNWINDLLKHATHEQQATILDNLNNKNALFTLTTNTSSRWSLSPQTTTHFAWTAAMTTLEKTRDQNTIVADNLLQIDLQRIATYTLDIPDNSEPTPEYIEFTLLCRADNLHDDACALLEKVETALGDLRFLCESPDETIADHTQALVKQTKTLLDAAKWRLAPRDISSAQEHTPSVVTIQQQLDAAATTLNQLQTAHSTQLEATLKAAEKKRQEAKTTHFDADLTKVATVMDAIKLLMITKKRQKTLGSLIKTNTFVHEYIVCLHAINQLHLQYKKIAATRDVDNDADELTQIEETLRAKKKELEQLHPKVAEILIGLEEKAADTTAMIKASSPVTITIPTPVVSRPQQRRLFRPSTWGWLVGAVALAIAGTSIAFVLGGISAAVAVTAATTGFTLPMLAAVAVTFIVISLSLALAATAVTAIGSSIARAWKARHAAHYTKTVPSTPLTTPATRSSYCKLLTCLCWPRSTYSNYNPVSSPVMEKRNPSTYDNQPLSPPSLVAGVSTANAFPDTAASSIATLPTSADGGTPTHSANVSPKQSPLPSPAKNNADDGTEEIIVVHKRTKANSAKRALFTSALMPATGCAAAQAAPLPPVQRVTV